MRKTRKIFGKKGKKGSGSTRLDPNPKEAYGQMLKEYPGAGSTDDLAKKALKEQNERRMEKLKNNVKFEGSLVEEKIETPKIEVDEIKVATKPKRKDSTESTGSTESIGSTESTSSKKSTSFVSGPSGYEVRAVLPGSTYTSRVGSKRKTHKRSTKKRKTHRRR